MNPSILIPPLHSFLHSLTHTHTYTHTISLRFSNKHQPFRSALFYFICFSLSSLAFTIAGGSARLNGRNLIPPIHGCSTSGISTPSLV